MGYLVIIITLCLLNLIYLKMLLNYHSIKHQYTLLINQSIILGIQVDLNYLSHTAL